MDRIFTDARVYPVATLPADPRHAHFDAFPDVTVRTVAFGSIPVDATLSLRLPTDASGLPAGLHALTMIDSYAGGAGDPPPEVKHPSSEWLKFSDSTVTGGVWVQVTQLSVDGVVVDVGNHCRTVQPAKLDLSGKGYSVNQAGESEGAPPAGHFAATRGGALTGTIDVPRFSGCGSGQDDLSPLVSSVASGEDFAVQAQTGALGSCWGASPAAIDWDQCPSPADLPIPRTAP
jgi:hypothetical protein